MTTWRNRQGIGAVRGRRQSSFRETVGQRSVGVEMTFEEEHQGRGPVEGNEGNGGTENSRSGDDNTLGGGTSGKGTGRRQ